MSTDDEKCPVNTVLPYRIVIHNLPAEEEVVQEQVTEELGNVTIVDWKVERMVHYHGPILGSSNAPQREIIVKLHYIQSETS